MNSMNAPIRRKIRRDTTSATQTPLNRPSRFSTTPRSWLKHVFIYAAAVLPSCRGCGPRHRSPTLPAPPGTCPGAAGRHRSSRQCDPSPPCSGWQQRAARLRSATGPGPRKMAWWAPAGVGCGPQTGTEQLCSWTWLCHSVAQHICGTTDRLTSGFHNHHHYHQCWQEVTSGYLQVVDLIVILVFWVQKPERGDMLHKSRPTVMQHHLNIHNNLMSTNWTGRCFLPYDVVNVVSVDSLQTFSRETHRNDIWINIWSHAEDQ